MLCSFTCMWVNVKFLYRTSQFIVPLTLVFTCLHHKSFENTVWKGEIACIKQFLLFPQCFLPFLRPFSHFQQIKKSCLQTLSVWKSLKFVVWERVKHFFHTILNSKDLEKDAFWKHWGRWRKYFCTCMRVNVKFLYWTSLYTCIVPLTLYHRIQSFNDLQKDAFWKHWGRWRKRYVFVHVCEYTLNIYIRLVHILSL